MDGKCSSTCIMLPIKATIGGPLSERAFFLKHAWNMGGDTNGGHKEDL
jgi:hypothetical protein